MNEAADVASDRGQELRTYAGRPHAQAVRQDVPGLQLHFLLADLLRVAIMLLTRKYYTASHETVWLHLACTKDRVFPIEPRHCLELHVQAAMVVTDTLRDTLLKQLLSPTGCGSSR